MRYAITDLSHAAPGFSLDAVESRRTLWLASLRRWFEAGIHFVQLREKALESGELFQLAQAGSTLLQSLATHRGQIVPRLLVNSRPDIAIAAGADGVHLTSRPGDLTPGQVRALFQAAGRPQCTVSVSCHTVEDSIIARSNGVDLVLFGPVFEKRVGGQLLAPGAGLDRLREACLQTSPVPVLALGGISAENMAACRAAGAAGVAAIRLFA